MNNRIPLAQSCIRLGRAAFALGYVTLAGRFLDDARHHLEMARREGAPA